MNYSEWIGAVGVFLILAAYVLSLFKITNSEKLLYLFLNIIGASLACLASILITYWPFVILEGVWALASIAMLVKLFLKRS